MQRSIKMAFRFGIAIAGLQVAMAVTETSAQAQGQVNIDQNAALTAVAKMTEAQRTYYNKHRRFQANIASLQQDFAITLPSSFNYAARTTTYSAYNYVIPTQPANTGSLKAFVGATFFTPGEKPKMITIICQNTQPGQIRPADPILVLGTAIANPTGSIVQCGDFSTQVSASVVNE
jgi:hypothetical protein